jgi:hypothetical protein
MPAAEDRQAKALEGIYYELRKMVKIHETLNVNLVSAIKMFEDFTALLETVETEAKEGPSLAQVAGVKYVPEIDDEYPKEDDRESTT